MANPRPTPPDDRARSWRGLLARGLLVLLTLGGTVRAEDEVEEPAPPREVPVEARLEVDETGAETLGRWVFHLGFRVLEDVDRAYRVELRLQYRGRELLQLDHTPKVPTPRWREGDDVTYRIPAPVPLEVGLKPGDQVDILVGFFDPAQEKTLPPREGPRLLGQRRHVAVVPYPDLGPVDAEERIAAIVANAEALAAEGHKPDAWRALETAIRRAEEDATKYRFRDALVALGSFTPEPPSLLEEQIVAKRIADELRRHLRKMAGRYFDRDKLYASLRLLEAIGGTLAEESDAAVIGALAEAERTERQIDDVKVRLLARIDDDADEAKARQQIDRLGMTAKLLAKGEAMLRDERYAAARTVFRSLATGKDEDLATQARTRLDELERAWLDATPPDEAALVEEALHDPAFERLATVATHKFLFIGPRVLVEGVPTASRLRYDIAYIFQTDLFGRIPNPGGDRITVYWKELWDFGGGQGGGKRIDIGRADPERRGYRVDTGLLYHELIHCVDDTRPIHLGFREGLANFGAAYTFEALGQKGDELHAFQANLEAFRKDYVARDLPYWRIPSYGPSAGFFLHFVETYAKTLDGHDWKPYRGFFRNFRAAPVRDGREPCVMRVLAYFLVEAFGEAAFADLIRFRFPLVDSDLEAIRQEMEAWRKGEYEVRRRAAAFEAYPNSPLARDARAGRMIGLFRGRRSPDEVRRVGREELGILYDWRAIGPFRQAGADPGAYVFPPEYEIDFEKEYLSGQNMCKWRTAGETGVVSVDPMGWIGFNFSYQDHTATYALNHVRVEQDVEAVFHLRADDDITLFVNDRRVGAYVGRGWNDSDRLWWRGPVERVPDAIRFPVRLQAGRNKVLVKVRNKFGGAGFTLAVSHPDGSPIAGLGTDLDPPTDAGTAPAEAPRVAWTSRVKHSFRTKAYGSKLEVAVGSFKVVGRKLIGQSTGKGVAWRKYTVRPGFPKDSPSNLAWIGERYTEGLDAFRLRLDLAPNNEGIPKIVVCFQGEGANDILSGWSLIVHPSKGKVAVRLERYDQLIYQTSKLEPPGGEIQTLTLEHVDGRLTATLGDLVLFDRRDVPPIPVHTRIGFATYGPGLGLAGFDLGVPK